MEIAKPHLVLIDGHHLMYRAFFAIPRTMVTSKGEQVNVTYGVASMLLNIILAEKPTHLLFCFDDGSETFRHRAFDGYKDGRAETPDDFYIQIPRVHELVAAFHLQSVSSKEHEADDFIASYARSAERDGFQVTIVSGDKDLLQLVTDTVRVAIPHKAYQQQEYMGPAQVRAKFGVDPLQIPSYKGLIGDASDNLPGVHGIGPKAAEALLAQHQTLSSLYDHLDEVKEAWRTKLLASKDNAFFSEKLALLITDIPLPTPIEELQFSVSSHQEIADFFTTLEFRSILQKLQKVNMLYSGSFEEVSSAVPPPVEQMSLFSL
jgi:DNA polymerase-1